MPPLPDVKTALSATLKAALDGDTATAYAVDRGTWRIGFVNCAFRAFAQDNGGDDRFGEGASLRDVVPEVLWPFYEERFDTVLATLQPVTHLYECSSPQVYRAARMRILPLGRGAGLLVLNDLLVQRPYPARGAVDAGVQYVQPSGVIVQCSHCRRVRRPDLPNLPNTDERWDWVPSFVAHPAQRLSHGLCTPCLEYHYPDDRALVAQPAR